MYLKQNVNVFSRFFFLIYSEWIRWMEWLRFRNDWFISFQTLLLHNLTWSFSVSKWTRKKYRNFSPSVIELMKIPCLVSQKLAFLHNPCHIFAYYRKLCFFRTLLSGLTIKSIYKGAGMYRTGDTRRPNVKNTHPRGEKEAKNATIERWPQGRKNVVNYYFSRTKPVFRHSENDKLPFLRTV